MIQFQPASGATIASPAAPPGIRPPAAGWLAGFSWNGLGLIALLCLVNAARRTSRDLDVDMPLAAMPAFVGTWLVRTTHATLLGLVVAIPVAVAVVAACNLAPRRPALRYPVLAAAVALSCVAGVLLMRALESAAGWTFVEDQSLLDPTVVALVRYGLLCALVAAVFVYLRVAEESLAQAEDAERDRARFVQRMEEARLKMLQAQIEPHFLFNTLANVRGLYEAAPPDAMRMLDNLMQYLAAALPQIRGNESTLGQEAGLTRAYLEIQSIRMGRRLAFDVDVPEALAGIAFPPLMLLTLAENAIKHGLAPQRAGGAIRVSAAAEDGLLILRVADSGGGFTRTSGKGTGLANIRARLAITYGAAGRLALARNVPQGVVASIVIPLPAVAPTAEGA